MATVIKGSCPDCGDVEFTTKEVILHLCENTGQFSYSFRCHYCLLLTAREINDDRIADALMAAGVRQRAWTVAPSPNPCPTAPQFTDDDAIDFHNFLAEGAAETFLASWTKESDDF